MSDPLDLTAIIALAVTLLAFVGIIVLRARKVGFTPLVLIALVIGIGVGIAFQGHLDLVDFIGAAYIQVITAIVAPLIFISILSSVTSLGSTAKLRTIGLSSGFWLLLTNVIAIVLTLAVALTLNLGRGVQLDLPDAGADSLTGLVKPLDQVLLGLLPNNLAGDFSSNAIAPIILFAVLLAVAFLVANRSEDRRLRTFKEFVDGAKQVIMTAVGFIIELTPYAVLALVATTTATAIGRIETVLSLFGVLVLAIGLAFVDAYLVNAVLLRVFADVNPLRWFRMLTPAQYTAFTTQSSIGTLPLTIPTLTKRVGVPEDVASFTAPIGTTIGMPGCSGIWPILVAVFSINVLGIQYSVGDYLILAGLCLLVSLGTAGVPGTAIVSATAVLTAVGLPIEILVVLIPISAIAGTASTMANVSAAATAATIVARRQGALNDNIFRSETTLTPAPTAHTVSAASAPNTGVTQPAEALPPAFAGQDAATQAVSTGAHASTTAATLTLPTTQTAVLPTAGEEPPTAPLYSDELLLGACEIPGSRERK